MIKIPKIKFEISKRWTDGECDHAPKSWPWWRRFSFLVCKMGVCAPSTGHRLWIYKRDRSGFHVGIIFDRRHYVSKR